MSDSHRSPSGSVDGAIVRELVAERLGREWCLFLDRDGVVNVRIVDDYVRSIDHFEWLPGAQEAIHMLRAWAPHLVVVTNQQGVGKGLMTADAVSDIHRHLQEGLDPGAIDEFLVCHHLKSDGCSCRKPEAGHVRDWLKSHPGVAASLSIVVGDSPSDMQLARNVAAETGGCAGIRIGTGSDPTVHASFESLWDFAVLVQRAREEMDQ